MVKAKFKGKLTVKVNIMVKAKLKDYTQNNAYYYGNFFVTYIFKIAAFVTIKIRVMIKLQSSYGLG